MMKAYPEYKDSGIEWLGEIPEHWGIKKLKHVANIVNGATPKSGVDEYWHGDITWLTPDDLGKLNDKVIIDSGRKITDKGLNSCGTTLTPAKSIVLSTRAPIGHIGITTISSCTNQGCKSIVPYKDLCDTIFYYYFLHVKKEILQSYGQGSTFIELQGQKLKGFPIVHPSLPEQQSIANYLDRKTQQIDTLIEKKQKMIELLKEERTAVINHAVTKGLPAEAAAKAGLNPDVKMKDSGIEWLGEIPEHWEMRKLKFISTTNDDTLPESTDVNYEIDYVDIGSVSEENGIEKSEVMIFKDAPSRARRKVQDGDVIVSTVRTYLKAIAFIKNPNKNLIVSTGFAVIRPMKKVFDSQYAAFAFHGTYLLEEVVSNSVGVSYPAINSSSLINIKIPMAALDEQQAIANYLDQKTRGIDSLIERNENSIEFLQEYRTALISEAVTGKIDVRDEVMA